MIEKSHKRDKQNFFFLGSIQSAAVGIPCFMLGSELAQKYTPGVAIGSIVVGNLILWLLAVAISSMGIEHHINGIQNIKNYIGKLGSLVSAAILFFCFLNWFALQIHFSVENIRGSYLSDYVIQRDFPVRIGTALGLFISLLALGEIRLLKWLSIITLPFLILYQCIAIAKSGLSPPAIEINFSFSAIASVVILFLPGVINIPTFFRHSRSKHDTFIAISMLAMMCTFFECSTVWIQSSSYYIIPHMDKYASLIFVILSLICCNLLNIYFASACYEAFIPKFYNIKSHAIIGLLGCSVYAFVQISPPMQFLAYIFDSYLVVLGIVLLISFLIRILVKHRPRNLEKWISFSASVVGCIGATLSKLSDPSDEINFLLVGIASSLIYFLIVIFIEETVWAISRICQKKTTNP